MALLTSEDTGLFQETRWPALESPPSSWHAFSRVAPYPCGFTLAPTSATPRSASQAQVSLLSHPAYRSHWVVLDQEAIIPCSPAPHPTPGPSAPHPTPRSPSPPPHPYVPQPPPHPRSPSSPPHPYGPQPPTPSSSRWFKVSPPLQPTELEVLRPVPT